MSVPSCSASYIDYPGRFESGTFVSKDTDTVLTCCIDHTAERG
jgi:hypothetical protein